MATPDDNSVPPPPESARSKEMEVLERYASAANNRVFASQADLDPKDRPLAELVPWCKEHGDIVVLKSGLILSSNPTSRDVQNCKTLLINKGRRPGRVVAATKSLIAMLLANAEQALTSGEQMAAPADVSDQQKRLRMVIKEAVEAGASDLHIEVREDYTRIRFRKNGEMYLHAEWSGTVGREVAAVAFNKETDVVTEHFNPLIPQNASMPLLIDGIDVRLRLASMPALGGFDMVMRILTAGETHIPTLDQLGYTEAQIAIIRRSVKMPHGSVLLAGPTGSGKTTTLASCITLVEKYRKAYTIEDPIEKIVDNATQVPVNTEKMDRGFASMGRATLRMDPDVIVLGEMRDEDTANVMVRAAITGHLVFSTIHTNSAPAIITRLVDMGISATLLGDTNLLVCLIFQRLVQKLCLDCCVPIETTEQDSDFMNRLQGEFGNDMDKIKVRNPNGCEKCNKLGITGRTVVAEVVWVDEPGRAFIQKGDTFGWEKYLRENGWMTYKDHALMLVREGKVDPHDAERLIGEINSKFSQASFNYRDYQ